MYRILIVDDEPSILSSLSRVLGKENDWDIETYDSVFDALKRAQTNNFELVISDYKMPEMDGVVFLNEIRELQPEAMRIILSGFTELEALLGAINEAEIFRYICKPWDNRELVETIRHALVHRDVVVENRRLADQVREQQAELNKRKTALESLAEKHPELVEVEWGPDGAIVIEDEYSAE